MTASAWSDIQNFYLPVSLGHEIVHPHIVTAFSHHSTGEASWETSITTQSYPAQFILYANPDAVHFTNDGYGGLKVTIGATTFTLPDFEDGRYIQGVGYFSSATQGGFGFASGTFGFTVNLGSIVANNPSDTEIFFPETGVQETYFLNSVTYGNSTTENMRDGVRILGTSGNDNLIGFDVNDYNGQSYNDTLIGLAGNDYLEGKAGDDTLNGGVGADSMFGGLGDDTYIIATGDGLVVAHPDEGIHEQDDEGTDKVLFTDINSSELRMWSNGSNNTIIAISDGSGGYYQTYLTSYNGSVNGTDLANKIETFEFQNGEIWDLTQGLTMVDTDEAHFLFGSDQDDILKGNGGGDTIYGYAGNDTLNGGVGADYLNGGLGDDTYIIATGDGLVAAHPDEGIHEQDDEGTDKVLFTDINSSELRMWSNGSNNTIVAISDGNGGYYQTYLTSYNGSVNGTDLANKIETFEFQNGEIWDLTQGLTMVDTDEAHFLFGSDQDDVLTGNGGGDTIYGYAGNDTLYGGEGADRMDGGLGDDTYIIATGDGLVAAHPDEGIHEQDDEGTDKVLFTDINSSELRMWSNGSNNTIIAISDGNGGYYQTYLTSYNGSVNGTDLANKIETFEFQNGETWDLTQGLTMVDTDDSHILYGSDQDDILKGNGGEDSLYGYAGNDKIYSGTGNDYVHLGDGNDYVKVGGGIEYFYGGAGIDTISYYDSVGGVTINLATNVISGGWADDDTISSFENVYASKLGDDHITGSAADNYIKTYYGNDVVYAGKGDDIVKLGGGDDYVRVGGGQEYFDGGSGVDTISYYKSSGGVKLNLATNTASGSWADNDTVKNFENVYASKTGDDHITGTSGANYIKTYGGNDKVYAGKGNDVVKLGSGDDYVRVGGGKEYFDGGSGVDTISYYNSTGGVTINLAANTASGSWAENDTVKNFENVYASKTGDDHITGTSGANYIKTYGGNDKVYAGGGDDIIKLGDGDDYVKAGGGNDIIYGGDGADKFDAGGGDDIIYGGAGVDIFHYDFGEDHDTIKDFENNIDTIELDNSGYADVAEAMTHATQVGSDVIFDFGSDDGLTIENATLSQLTNDLMLV